MVGLPSDTSGSPTAAMKAFGRLAVLVLVVGWCIWLRPLSFGGPASYQIVSGHSMEPLLHTGDLVITQASSAYAAGDLIAFHVPAGQPGAGMVVIHRIVSGDSVNGWTTKGDNNPRPDPWHPKAADVLGRSWIELSGSGQCLLVLRRPLVLAAIVGGLFGFWFFTTDFKVRPRPGGNGQGPWNWRRRNAEVTSPDALES